MKLFSKESDSGKRMMLMLLVAAGILEFLFIILESRVGFLGYYLTEEYLIVPALLFVGSMLSRQVNDFAKCRLLLAGAAISWFVITQCIHKFLGMDTHPIGTVFFVYLMAFPFASVSEDRENVGFRWIGGMFLTASMILVFYTVLLLLKLIPQAWADCVYWDGARLHVMWHPNISACFFMLGVGFAAVFLVQAKNMRTKVLLMVAIAAQMAAMAMTNCRTTLLMTGAMLGAIVFLVILQRFQPKFPRKAGKGKVHLMILCVVLVLAILVSFFLVAGKMYQWNNDRLLEESATGVLVTQNGQGSFLNDLRTLNGRTYIWKAAFSAIRDNKMIALFGTEYSGTAISVYNPFEVVHGHNSWVEVMMRMGLPGLLMSLLFTALAVFSGAKLVLNPATELWKKIVAVLVVCLLGAGFLEPYLFITNVYYHVTDFAFFFLTGYLDYWTNSEKF